MARADSSLNQLIDSLSDLIADSVTARLTSKLSGLGLSGGAGARSARGGRRGGGSRRPLDMSCRVAGCKNMSRGPRFGFICDDHREKLSAAEQRQAREEWKARHGGKAAPAKRGRKPGRKAKK